MRAECDHAEAARAACDASEVTQYVERLVRAVVLLSRLDSENRGHSFVHFLTLGLVEARDAIHGAQVAWALLAHLAAEELPNKKSVALMALYRKIAWPTRSADLGMFDPSDGASEDLARLTITASRLDDFLAGLNRELIAAAIPNRLLLWLPPSVQEVSGLAGE